MFVASGLGLGALWKRRQHRRSAAESIYGLPEEGGRDPAAELRAKLAETKAATDAQPEAGAAREEGAPLDPESRRRDVHERARASIDELS
jgi:hypothetical protein